MTDTALPPLVVASFWVHWPKLFPKETKLYDYAKMLLTLDRCCKRFGYRHMVLTDWPTMPMVSELGLQAYGIAVDANLMKAVTQVQAAFMASPYTKDTDTLFVGADCLIRREIRNLVPPGDMAIAFMKEHRQWRINTGFVYSRAKARDQMIKLLDHVRDDVQPRMCDDMAAYERALNPMPKDYGMAHRFGMDVQFVDLDEWNHPPLSPDDEAPTAHVLHFYGEKSKIHFHPWAERWLPKDDAP